MRKLKKILVIPVILALQLGWSGCEDKIKLEEYGDIMGRVIEDESGQPIVGANISSSPSTTALITDNDGLFFLSDVSIGDYNILAKKTNYANTTVGVVVRADKTVDVVISMKKNEDIGQFDIRILDPVPATSSINQNLTTQLAWRVENPHHVDTLKYTVKLYEGDAVTPVEIYELLTDTMVEVKDLQFNETYFWQVAVFLDGDEQTQSEMFSFQTLPVPEYTLAYVQKKKESYELFLSDTAATNSYQITHSVISRDWFPVVDPKNEMIAYSSNVSDEVHVYVIDVNGGTPYKVTSLPLAGYHNQGVGLCWSPDGGEIAYCHYQKLYALRSDGTALRQIANAPQNRHFRMCSWAAYGNNIAVQTMGSEVYDSEIFVVNPDNGQLRLLVGNEPGRTGSPSFSIDGTGLLFTHDADGLNSPDGRQLNSRIYKIATDSSAVVDLSVNKPEGTNDLYPRYSPDGASIIFVNTPNTGTGTDDIYVMDANGTNRRKIIDDATMPYWYKL